MAESKSKKDELSASPIIEGSSKEKESSTSTNKSTYSYTTSNSKDSKKTKEKSNKTTNASKAKKSGGSNTAVIVVIVILLVTCLICCLCLGGITILPALTPVQPRPYPGGSLPKPDSPQTLTQSQTGKADDLEIRILSVKPYTAYSSTFAPKKGYEYLAVEVEFENTGETMEVYGPTYFELRDQYDKYETYSHQYLTGITNPLGTGTLTKGQTKTGKLVFEIPTSLESYETELVYANNLGADETTLIWMLR